jgi:hypothetical protein
VSSRQGAWKNLQIKLQRRKRRRRRRGHLLEVIEAAE